MKSDRNFCQIFCIFFDRFSLKSLISNFTKILPVGTELINAYIRADGFRDLSERVWKDWACRFNSRGYRVYWLEYEVPWLSGMQIAPFLRYHFNLVWLYHFLHYLINGMIFGKKVIEHKCLFWFSLQILPETFLSLRWNQQDVITNVYRSSCKVPVSLVRL